MSITAYQPFPVIAIEGDARECGMQHGAQAAERVARCTKRAVALSKRCFRPMPPKANRTYQAHFESLTDPIRVQVVEL